MVRALKSPPPIHESSIASDNNCFLLFFITSSFIIISSQTVQYNTLTKHSIQKYAQALLHRTQVMRILPISSCLMEGNFFPNSSSLPYSDSGRCINPNVHICQALQIYAVTRPLKGSGKPSYIFYEIFVLPRYQPNHAISGYIPVQYREYQRKDF